MTKIICFENFLCYDNKKIRCRFMDKNTIISEATKLFYDYGITDVSFKQIAEKCGIAPTLITYYFNTKGGIVESVANLYATNLRCALNNKLYDMRIAHNELIFDALSIIVHLHMFDEDEKARRFEIERLNGGFNHILEAEFMDVYKNLDRHIIFDIDRGKGELHCYGVSAHVASLSMIYSYYKGRLDCTFEQFVDNSLNVRYKLFNLPQERIATVIDEAKRLYDLLDIKILPYFEIE